MLTLDALGPEHTDVITTGGVVISALIGTVGVVLAALIQSGRKAAKSAESAAQTAAAQTQDNSADHTHVAEVLEEIQVELLRTRREFTEYRQQSESRHRENRADMLGIHEEIRQERAERQELARQVINHLNPQEQR